MAFVSPFDRWLESEPGGLAQNSLSPETGRFAETSRSSRLNLCLAVWNSWETLQIPRQSTGPRRFWLTSHFRKVSQSRFWRQWRVGSLLWQHPSVGSQKSSKTASTDSSAMESNRMSNASSLR